MFDVVMLGAELFRFVILERPKHGRFQQLDLPAVTSVMLDELELRLAGDFRHDLPVPFYRVPFGRFIREML